MLGDGVDQLRNASPIQCHGAQNGWNPLRLISLHRRLTWQGFESVASGLGNGNGEILGGIWTLLVSLAALRVGGLPKAQNILGLVVGAVGILSIFPALTGLTGIFGLGQMIWFVWLGVVLLRESVKDKPATVRPSNRELA